MPIPPTVPTGSRRITPYLDLRHDWLLQGSSGVGGRMEKWSDGPRSFELQANCDRTATLNYQDHPFGSTIPIRPMHAHIDETAFPGPNFRRFNSNPDINTFAWDFYEQFFPDENTEGGGVFFHEENEYREDKKKDTTQPNGERRCWVWNPLACYAHGVNDEYSFEAHLRNWVRWGIRRRPLFHASNPSSGVWQPCEIDHLFWNPKNDVHKWGISKTWSDADGAWTGAFDAGYDGYNCIDKGHNETGPQIFAAIAGIPEGYVYLWKQWEWFANGLHPSWDRSSGRQSDNQPRAGAMAIRIIIHAWLAGFEYADPTLYAELCGGTYGKNGSRGYRPSEILDYVLRWILTDRFTGGVGDGGAGANDMDGSGSGNNNVMNELCQAALTLYDDRGDQDPKNDIYWWYFNGVPTFRLPCYAGYIWQPAFKLWAFHLARRFYVYMTGLGVEPFGSDVYTGLGEAIDYFADYYYQIAVPKTAGVFMAQGEIGYSATFDHYHNPTDQALAGNRYGYNDFDRRPIVDPGEPLEVFKALQDDFVNVCGQSKWGNDQREFVQQPSGRYTVVDQDSAKTGMAFLLTVMGLHWGKNDPRFQFCYASSARKARVNSSSYTSEWIKYVDPLHRMLGDPSDELEETVDLFSNPVLTVSRNHSPPPGLPLPSSPPIFLRDITFQVRGLLGVSRTLQGGFRTITLRARGLLDTTVAADGERSIHLQVVGEVSSEVFAGQSNSLSSQYTLRVSRLVVPPYPGKKRNLVSITELAFERTTVARTFTLVSAATLGVSTDTNRHMVFSAGTELEFARELARAAIALEAASELEVTRTVSEPMTFSSLPRPVLEPVQIDPSSGIVRLRVWRVPGGLMDSGGYRIYRSTRRDGFAGTLGTDFELLAENVTQPDSGTTYTDKVLTAQPTDTDLWYRVVAIDSFSTETIRSQPSNVVWVRWLGTRQIQVPVIPCELQPSFGPLKGILPDLEANDTEAGMTWFEFRSALISAGEALWEELRHSQDDASASNLFRDPPPDLCNWFRWQCVLELLPLCGLQPKELEERINLARRYRGEARDEFLEEGVTFSPGGAPAPTQSIRVRR